ncbi:MAG TPA: UDP-2,3-diacylglucosamine diphosphatase LpxI [Acidobacteriota bacterium]|nr:UDP-2,3-diacylglucosamine diphosphatase LpxI [Acidobacteriota bacterium]
MSSPEIRRLGLIAGNGRLPLLALEEAVGLGLGVTVAAVQEEAEGDVARLAEQNPDQVTLHRVGVGRLGKLIRLFKREGVDHAVMVGQVRHIRIFAADSSAPRTFLSQLPDLRMLQLVRSLPKKDTSSLISAVIGELEKEGIRFLDSTMFLSRILAPEGVLTKRGPSKEEARDIEYGRKIAREVARLDLGQTIVVKNQAVVAIEAMEGTDETIRRAARLAANERLTVVKAARPQQDMRYDVPVIGLTTLQVLRECSVSALALDAGRTLIVDRDEFVRGAEESGICVVAMKL